MNELDVIISAYDAAKEKGQAVILATVVHVEGSSYRRAGARMLVDEFGHLTGAISGGCLEGDALRRALHALHQQRNKLVTYDTRDEEDAIIGAQLGCNGVIQVLFEPIDFDSSKNPVEILRVAQADRPSVVITLFHLDGESEQMGTTGWINDTQRQIEGSVPQLIKNEIEKEAKAALVNQSSLFREYLLSGGSQHLFFECIKRPIRLVLVGAGNDAQIMTLMAAPLGWDIIVADGRPTHAHPDRFVSACQVVVAAPEQVLDEIKIDDRTAFVLLTHNYNYDLALLKLLLVEEDLRYIGLLGPFKKYERMLGDVKQAGIAITQAMEAKIHAPVGLALQAETPAEIALSVLAEIQAVFSGADAPFLKNEKGPIHQKKNNDFKQVSIG